MVVSTASAEFAVLIADIIGRGDTPIGILLLDPAGDELHIRLRRDLPLICDEEEAEVLTLVEGDLAAKAREMGARRLLEWLQENASNSIRTSDRESAIVENFPRALNRLYRGYVRSEPRPFETHLPRYTLQAAAGKFRDNEDVTEQGWVEAPRDLHLLPDMFVAEVVGQSMEPVIPSGSLCIFRAGVAGSRASRLVLVEDLQTSGTNRYTVKRYRSEKRPAESGWVHARIQLESLNPEYPSWDLDPDEDKYRIIAEFLRVLD
jgi:phage repressor protein C with HTH and peptisase S24 domain